MKWYKRPGMGVVIFVFTLAIVLRLHMLVASSLFVPVTSDESITIMQAKEIASGTPSLFVWAQPYQFPVETYIAAPLVKILPRNGFGARFHSFVISFLSLCFLFMIVRKLGHGRQTWPVLLLVLFPSAYLLMIQFGYPVPHYTPAFLFWWIAVFSAMHSGGQLSVKGMMPVAVSGLFCGLAFTNNMVSLSIVLPIAIVVCWGQSWKRLLVNIPVFGAGMFLGLLPYLIGIWINPDAQAAVAGTRSLGEAMGRIWSPMLSATLPRALGVDPGIFPDSHHYLGYGKSLLKFVGVVYAAVIMYATVLAVLRIVEELMARKRPALTVNEIFIGASWLGLMLFLMSKRAGSNDYRYLSPAAWSFPFLLYYVYNGLPRIGRYLCGMFVILLVCFNVGSSLRLINRWRDPDYAGEVVGAPDLTPAIEFMRDKGIKHCVASHWAAYRINFLTDEDIICSQPQNERFPKWSVPYKEQVDASDKVAYVLTDYVRFLRPDKFEKHMKQMRVTSNVEDCGKFRVYYGFKSGFRGGESEVALSPDSLSVSHGNEGLANILDGSHDTFWRSSILQQENMHLDVALSETKHLNRISIYYGQWSHDIPGKIAIEYHDGRAWLPLEYEMYDKPDDVFRFENNHPVYGYPSVQNFMLKEPVSVKTLRIRIAEAKSKMAWTITGLKLFSVESK